MSLETFLNRTESDLLQVTNPAMFKKLFDTLKRLISFMERIQYQDCCSSIEVQTESPADSGNLEILREKNEIDEYQDNIESGFSEMTKCHRPCEPLPVKFDGNNYKENYTKIIPEVKNEIPQSGETTEDVKLEVVRSEEISFESQSKYLSAEKLIVSNQDIPCEMRSTDCRNPPLSNADLQSEIREEITSNLLDEANHSNDEICCITDKVAASNSCNSDTNDKASLVVISQSSRNDEIDHCCQEDSEVDLDTFVNTVAAQLRELTTEAALRSQQRIQTLISNSRLESERNMQHR
ncbi:uncharacterized protein LOC125500604 [Athalia rosae]|uniref:uncharacterized protein LOC125500604 n=1 Tax=Athalia rosae TaxID=37344 RepID=UPI002033EF18|nr:uncharacterized protein LOC125500604 [Athalia rosae]